MDVSLPIASVIPSLDGPVYAELAATTAPLTLTQVHQLAEHGSLEGVRRALRRMVRAGLVLKIPGGYLLNREHLGAPAIEELAGLYRQFVERVRQAVVEWGGPVELVGMFGSAARRDGSEDSDIDVLVVSDSPDLDEFTTTLAAAIRSWTGNDAQVVGRSPAELRQLRKAKEPIVTRWDEELVVLCGSRQALLEAA